MSNQYTAAREQGIGPEDEAWPKQAETRREHPEAVRAAIKASLAVHYLEEVLTNPEADPAHRISASKILLDKTVATLSSVEQTVHDGDANNPDETEAKLRMLINKADPALLSRLGFRPHAVQTSNTPPDQGLDSTIPAQSIAK